MASQRQTKRGALTVAESGTATPPVNRRMAPAARRRRRRVSSPPTILERLRSVVGKAKGLPPDAALNHDHYLYGLPRQ